MVEVKINPDKYSDFDIDWASVGIGWNMDLSKLKSDVDPEKLFIDSMKRISEKPHYIPLILIWAKIYSDLIDKHRLVELSESIEDEPSVRLFYAILFKLSRISPDGWKVARSEFEEVNKNVSKFLLRKKFFDIHGNEILSAESRRKIDSDFLKAGIVAQLLEDDYLDSFKKKLRDKSGFTSKNSYLQKRASK